MPTSCFAFDELTTCANLPRLPRRRSTTPSVGAAVHRWSTSVYHQRARGPSPPGTVGMSFRVRSTRDLCRKACQDPRLHALRRLRHRWCAQKENLGIIVRWCAEELPESAPPLARHLEPDVSSSASKTGVDTFDCVSPTRRGTQRRRPTPTGRYNISNADSRRTSLAHLRGLRQATPATTPRAYLRHPKAGTSVWRRPSPPSHCRARHRAHGGRRPRSHQRRHLLRVPMSSSATTTSGKKP